MAAVPSCSGSGLERRQVGRLRIRELPTALLEPLVGGVDSFKADIDAKLAAIGQTTHYADNWEVYHACMGEIHCGTGTERMPSFSGPWWSIINK